MRHERRNGHRSASMLNARQRGFTLIEVLCVCALFAVLAAILLPVCAAVRNSSRSAACRANLRQITVALQMYASDHEDSLPPLGYDLPDGRVSLPYILRDGIKNGRVWKCPASAETIRQFFSALSHPPKPLSFYSEDYDGSTDDEYVSYALNPQLLRLTGTDPDQLWISSGETMASINKPAQTVAFIDASSTATAPGVLGTEESNERYRHSGCAIVAFLDGHVATCQPSRLSEQASSEEGVSLPAATLRLHQGQLFTALEPESTYLLWNRF